MNLIYFFVAWPRAVGSTANRSERSFYFEVPPFLPLDQPEVAAPEYECTGAGISGSGSDLLVQAKWHITVKPFLEAGLLLTKPIGLFLVFLANSHTEQRHPQEYKSYIVESEII
ncbi:hypothetical protein NL676_006137 [Syzygium grande]|nr:hypothetical protein NL676_006137 [Syzygium grande]